MRNPSVTAPWLCLLSLALAGCKDGPYLMFEEYQAPGGNERYLGGGCMSLGAGTGSSGSGVAGGAGVDALPPYTVNYETSEDAIDITFTDGAGAVLDTRNYTEEFIDSGKVDEVVVELGTGYVKFRYWGGEECETPRDPGE